MDGELFQKIEADNATFTVSLRHGRAYCGNCKARKHLTQKGDSIHCANCDTWNAIPPVLKAALERA